MYSYQYKLKKHLKYILNLWLVVTNCLDSNVCCCTHIEAAWPSNDKRNVQQHFTYKHSNIERIMLLDFATKVKAMGCPKKMIKKEKQKNKK